ncbi:hypothetical protein BDN70DRAFT_887255 [Pholiota conissans]|uniref:Uncharacterized protein n=1 Tax=Pholiota conissans TaxID=109636 RepID=A0A9P5YNJ0_9AGAR|nr:hypothetical protein BDN70DRAFT_887255 [Pholiota conissans]
MQFASTGVRNAARNGSNAIVHHGGHNRSGGPTAANHPNKFIRATNLFCAPHIPSIPTLPRDPHYKLFSASKNLLQRFFEHLTAPGLRVPPYIAEVQYYSARSLHGTSLRGSRIQNGLSLPVRYALRSYALQRQANMFLPGGPGPIPLRSGGIAQVGLGSARTFSTTRPIFQQIAQNIPIAGRSLYEIDWDLETRKEYERICLSRTITSKQTRKAPTILKASEMCNYVVATPDKENDAATFRRDIEHYFTSIENPLVSTYLFVPLAPTPTARLPLCPDPFLSRNQEPTLLSPFSSVGILHTSHATHALRVSTLFTRLDQANVWSSGAVHCSAYSQGRAHQRLSSKQEGSDDGGEGVCTILKIEFKGWLQCEVRSIIGESGTGWCILEEVISPEEAPDVYSDSDSLASSVVEDHLFFGETSARQFASIAFDPADSFILPILDVSANSSPTSSSPGSLSAARVLSKIPLEVETDPWMDD